MQLRALALVPAFVAAFVAVLVVGKLSEGERPRR
jgi:hypothetical protein